MRDRPGTALGVKRKADMVNWKLVYWYLHVRRGAAGGCGVLGGMCAWNGGAALRYLRALAVLDGQGTTKDIMI